MISGDLECFPGKEFGRCSCLLSDIDFYISAVFGMDGKQISFGVDGISARNIDVYAGFGCNFIEHFRSERKIVFKTVHFQVPKSLY